jgi:hypothetical protein
MWDGAGKCKGPHPHRDFRLHYEAGVGTSGHHATQCWKLCTGSGVAVTHSATAAPAYSMKGARCIGLREAALLNSAVVLRPGMACGQCTCVCSGPSGPSVLRSLRTDAAWHMDTYCW